MLQVSVADAQADLQRLISLALSGERVVIARDAESLVLLQPVPAATGQRQIGAGRGLVLHIAEDFDETPDDFKEYLE